MKKITICAIVWKSHIPLWLRAARQLDWLDFQVYSSEQVADDFAKLDTALKAAQRADLVYCYRSTENFWEYVAEQMTAWPHKPPVVCISHDPSLWALSTVGLEVASRCHDYFVYGGEGNYANMLRYMAATVLGRDVAFDEPQPQPWEGFYHPAAPVRHFATLDEYLAWYEKQHLPQHLRHAPAVGILIGRSYWVSENLEVENTVIRSMEEQGLRVIPVFSHSMKDDALGTRGSAAVVRDAFIRADGSVRIQALVKLMGFFLDMQKGGAAETASMPRKPSACCSSWMCPCLAPSSRRKKRVPNGRPTTRA